MSSDGEKKAGDRTRDQKRSYVCRTRNRRREEVHTHTHQNTTKPQQKNECCAVLEKYQLQLQQDFFSYENIKAQGCLSTTPQIHTHTDTHSNQTWPNVNQIKAALVRETKGIVVLLCARLGMSDLIT